MKRFYAIAAAAALACTLFCGCSRKKTGKADSTAQTDPVLTTAAESIPELSSDADNENLPDERDFKPAEGSYVYDNAKILSKEEVSACNNYAEWLYENYLINTAVVTTDSLDDKAPYDYAADAYNKIYEGKGSGLLLLINNDTNIDILYKTGSCNTFISAEDSDLALYWATKEIVAGDYKSAVLRMLKLAENCPQHIFDNAGIFSIEQITALEAVFSSYENEVSLLATNNPSEIPNEDILRSYYDRRYKDSKGYMLMLDAYSKSLIAFSEEPLPDSFEAALKKANESVKKGDYQGAVKAAADAIK